MDEMIIVDAKTGKGKIVIDEDNNIIDVHTCTFADFEDDSKCIYCGITVKDFTEKGVGTPIINPNCGENK